MPFGGSPRDPAELTAEIVTAALAEVHPGVVDDRCAVVDTKRRGEGIASTADRVTIEVAYRAGGEYLPERGNTYLLPGGRADHNEATMEWSGAPASLFAPPATPRPRAAARPGGGIEVAEVEAPGVGLP